MADALESQDYALAMSLLRDEGKLQLPMEVWLLCQIEGEDAAHDRAASAIADGTVVGAKAEELIGALVRDFPHLAVRVFETLKLSSPDIELTSNSNLYLSMAYVALGDRQKSEALLQSTLGSADDLEVARSAVVKFAVDAQGHQDPESGLRFIESAIELMPELSIDPYVLLQQASLFANSNRPGDSIVAVGRIRNEYPRFSEEHAAELLLLEAQSSEELGDTEQAFQLFKELLELANLDLRFQQFAVVAQLKIKQFEKDRDIQKMLEAERESVRQRSPDLTANRSRPRHVALVLINLILFLAIVGYFFMRRRQAGKG